MWAGWFLTAVGPQAWSWAVPWRWRIPSPRLCTSCLHLVAVGDGNKIYLKYKYLFICICVSSYLFICTSVIYLLIHLFISTYLFTYSFTYSFVNIDFIYLSIIYPLSIYLSVYLPTYLVIYLSIYLSTYSFQSLVCWLVYLSNYHLPIYFCEQSKLVVYKLTLCSMWFGYETSYLPELFMFERIKYF